MNQNVSSKIAVQAPTRKWKPLLLLVLLFGIHLITPEAAHALTSPSLWTYQYTTNNPGLPSDIYHGESDGTLTICKGAVVDVFGAYGLGAIDPNTPLAPSVQLIQWVGSGAVIAPDAGNTGGVGDPWQFIGSPSSYVPPGGFTGVTSTESITFNIAGTYHYSVVGFHNGSTFYPGNYVITIDVESPVSGSAALTVTNNFCSGSANDILIDGPSGFDSEVIITDANGTIVNQFHTYFIFGGGPQPLSSNGIFLNPNEDYTIQHIMSNSCGNSLTWTGYFSTYGPEVEASDLTICPSDASPAIVVSTVSGSIAAVSYKLYNSSYTEIASNTSGVFVLTLPPGNYTYYVKGVSAGGCLSENFEEVTVTIHHPTPAYIYNNISYCLPDGSPSLIAHTASGPSDATSFTLYINGIAHSSSTSGNFLVTEANFNYGVNNCQVVITSPCETTTSNFTVSEGNVPQFFANDIEICLEEIPSTGVDINLGLAAPFNGNIDYSISGPNGLTTGVSGYNLFTLNLPESLFINQGSGLYTIDVTAIDDFGCRTSRSLRVTIRVNDCPCNVRTNFNALWFNGGGNCTVEFKPLISIGSDMAMISQFWDYGDGTTALNPSSPNTHTYTGLAAPTVFNVCFTVTAKHIASGRICKVSICHRVAVDCQNGTVEILGSHRKKEDVPTETLEALSSSLEMYPNPTEGRFTLEWDSLNNEDAHILIYNSTGMLVYEAHTAEDLMEIDLSNQATGLYLVTVQTGTKLFKEQIILR